MIVPILLYHGVAEDPPPGLAPFFIHPDRFRAHMELLVSLGRPTCTVSEHVDRLEDFAKLIIATCFETMPAQRVQLAVMKPDIFHEIDAIGLEFDVRREDFSA